MRTLIGIVCMAVSAALADAVPELLVCEDGTKVTTKEVWEAKRCPEILETFKREVFGRNDVERPETLTFRDESEPKIMMDGKAVRRQVAISYSGPGGTGTIHLLAFIPRSAKPSPTFLLICNRPAKDNLDPERINKIEFWPAEEIVNRGYAALAFANRDVQDDKWNGYTNGVHKVFQPDPSKRKDDSWATIAAWAWGASRVMDWIETEPTLDASHVAVAGHSRGGKTALWCAATDRRFAMACSNDSGCTGAKLNKGCPEKSEHISQINKVFPHWFCTNYRKWNGKDQELPFDQHWELALIAPRLLCVASASKDPWAGPVNEFACCKYASPAWELYGEKGFAGTEFPNPGEAIQDGRISYHLREGKHDLALFDWTKYMDFADKHWRK